MNKQNKVYIFAKNFTLLAFLRKFFYQALQYSNSSLVARAFSIDVIACHVKEGVLRAKSGVWGYKPSGGIGEKLENFCYNNLGGGAHGSALVIGVPGSFIVLRK